MLKRFFNDESAQGMTEYVLIVALVAVVVIAAIKLFGKQILELFQKSKTKISDETQGFNSNRE